MHSQHLISAEKPALDPSTAQKWTLSANDIDDDDVVCNDLFSLVPFVKYPYPARCFAPSLLQDLVDSDALLDADDLKKPDPSSLKASCGDDSKKKKKACKNW